MQLKALFVLKVQSYLSFLAIVRVVHEVKSAIWWKVNQLSQFVRVVSLKGRKLSIICVHDSFIYSILSHITLT